MPLSGVDSGEFLIPCVIILLAGLGFAQPVHGERSNLNDTCFRIYMDDHPVGYDCVEFTRAGSQQELRVRRSIRIQVRYAGITVYQYRHEDRELWVNDQLRKLESWTNDDGSQFHVRAKRFEKGLMVNNGDTRFWVDHDIIPTSYWNKDLVDSNKLLDTQSGILRNVNIEHKGNRTVAARNGSRNVMVYDISGEIELTVGYDTSDRWRWLQFRQAGSTFEYKPTELSANEWRRDSFYDRTLNVKTLGKDSI